VSSVGLRARAQSCLRLDPTSRKRENKKQFWNSVSSVTMGVQSWVAMLKKALKYYAIFAVFHSLAKIYSRFREIMRFRRCVKDLPGYDVDFFAREIRKNIKRRHDWILDLSKEFPHAPLLRRPAPDMLLLANTPESIEWMLKTEFMNVTKPSNESDKIFSLLSQWLGPSIFILRHGNGVSQKEHDKWLMQRKSASLIFTARMFNSLMHETFTEKGQQILKVLRAAADNNEGVSSNWMKDGASACDMQRMFFMFTFDSIQRIFFGVDISSLENGKEDEYAAAFDAAHESMMRHLFGGIGWILLNNIVLPFPFGDLTSRSGGPSLFMTIFQHFNPAYQDFVENIKYLREKTDERVRAIRADPDLKNRRDLVANYINASMKEGTTPATDEEVRHFILNSVIAGRDTTGSLLSWLFYELSINQDVQQKLGEELDTVLKGKVPSTEDVNPNNLPYLNGCIYEALRLHPPVPTDVKVSTADLDFNGTTIPKGTRLAFSPYALNRLSKYYDEPLQFNPDRWIPFKEPTEYEFPVFQGFRRVCVGKPMALLEIRLLTAMLCQTPENGRGLSFHLEESLQGRVTYSNMITMSVEIKHDEKDELSKRSRELYMVPRYRN